MNPQDSGFFVFAFSFTGSSSIGQSLRSKGIHTLSYLDCLKRSSYISAIAYILYGKSRKSDKI
jgi:hypothetical protein